MDDPSAIERGLDEAIRKNRTARATLRLTAGGKPLANRELVVEQASHEFRFGTAWGNSTLAFAEGKLEGRQLELARARNERFLELFNQATLPFYWGRYEPERGRPDFERIMATAQWYRGRGVALKGHPLCWHTVCAPWLLDLADDEILEAQKARIRRELRAFAGVVDAWDVVNEAVIMPVFDKYDNGATRICKRLGRVGLLRAMFDEARGTDPKATLLLNDFDVSPAYERLIEESLEAGVEIDVVGIQSHMHQGYWGPDKTNDVLDRFERFGLPIHFTENTIVSGRIMPPEIEDLNDYKVGSWPSTPDGEERQAREVALHYKVLFARPSVASITWWDLSDGGWLGAPAGLLTADHEPKPAYEALRKLVKGEWWTGPTKLRSDAEGIVAVEGFKGSYRLRVEGGQASFTLAGGIGEPIELRL